MIAVKAITLLLAVWILLATVSPLELSCHEASSCVAEAASIGIAHIQPLLISILILWVPLSEGLPSLIDHPPMRR